ncbi:MAG: hypothetical protein AAFZ17_02455 [Cyanobacteria bacterium J06650_10]
MSESRGKEAAGMALLNQKRILIHKDALPGSRMIKGREYRNHISRTFGDSYLREATTLTSPVAAVGHSRLVTNGFQGVDFNNQPVVKNGVVVIHNGIVVNAERLWQNSPSIHREFEVDTEVIADLIALYRSQGLSVSDAVSKTLSQIEGEASIAVLFKDLNCLVLATNTGSIFVRMIQKEKLFLFASEAFILRELHRQEDSLDLSSTDEIYQVRAGKGLTLDLNAFSLSQFHFRGEAPAHTAAETTNLSSNLVASRLIESKGAILQARRDRLKRCSRCILPETMPFIEFDGQGVCNYCRSYQKATMLGEDALEVTLSKYRRSDGEPDCLVAFSGGRDSSYGLHLLKNELGMNPIAYTYDWGMVTDLGRRNQARMCGKLGIEHIWVSADIKAKRANALKNVQAWSRRPDLGMVPLFMAGDKQFFYYANKIMQQTGIELMVFCPNKLEKTDFKAGFCGVSPNFNENQPFALGLSQKAKLFSYYASQYALNPAYINRSFLDTLFAIFSYYVIETSFIYLYDYLPWDEDEINRVLIEEYDWELANDTPTTWRIGDATAPFYNYIYYTVAGFTEHDTFRSNQIREGVMERDTALDLVQIENQPRWESIQEYAQLIGLDFGDIVRAVDAMPKLY